MTNTMTLSEKVEDYLRSKILNGELLPNDKIVETEVAQIIGVSRGPVRDALKTLTFEGLIDYQPNKGCSVKTLSPKDAYEVFFMRGTLEKTALKLCGGKLSEETLLKMSIALEEMKFACQERDLSKLITADEMFHYQIIQMGKMSRLTKMWQILSPLNGAMFLTVINSKKIGEDIFSEPSDNPYAIDRKNNYEAHRAMFSVLKKGDLTESMLFLDAHYTLVGEKIYRINLREEARKKVYL